MSRLTKIRLENVQCWKHLELDVGDFTVLVGRTDQGKTAIIRAVGAVLTNAPGKSLIRNGCSSCEVELTFSDGLEILYKKGVSSTYTITKDGQSTSYNKMGRDVPPEIAVLVHPWEIGKAEKAIVQVQSQKETDFLLGGSRATMGRGLDSLDSMVYRKALEACVSVLRKLKREKNTCEQQRESWAEQRELSDEVPELRTEFENVLGRVNFLRRVSDWLDRVSVPSMEKSSSLAKLVVLEDLEEPVSLELTGVLIKSLVLSDLPEDPSDLSLVDGLAKLEVCSDFLLESENELLNLDKDLKEVKDVLFGEGVCPVCGGQVGTYNS